MIYYDLYTRSINTTSSIQYINNKETRYNDFYYYYFDNLTLLQSLKFAQVTFATSRRQSDCVVSKGKKKESPRLYRHNSVSGALVIHDRAWV